VSEHHAAYEAMHDTLLEALNEEPQNGEPREQPQQGPGAA
jgi:predicted RNA polymerase sigma factor